VVIGRVQISAAHHVVLVRSLHYCFFIFSGLCGLGIILSLARGELRNGGAMEPLGRANTRKERNR